MGKQYRDNEINGAGHVQDLLSAYIDHSLEEAEYEHVRAHLEGCAACSTDYEELQATRRMLQNMPAVLVPRPFTLTPEMAARARKTSFFERIFAPGSAPTFASGSVVAFALLLFLFVSANLTANPSPSVAPPEMALMQSTQDTGGSAQQDAQPGGDTARIAEAPTSTTGVAESTPEDSVAKQSPTQPVEAALMPQGTPAPDATAQPAAGTGEEPDTTTSSSETPGPTTAPITDTYYNPATENAAPGAGAGGSEDGSEPALAAQTPLAQDFNLLLAVEIGLLIIGLTLAVAALIARRRTT